MSEVAASLSTWMLNVGCSISHVEINVQTIATNMKWSSRSNMLWPSISPTRDPATGKAWSPTVERLIFHKDRLTDTIIPYCGDVSKTFQDLDRDHDLNFKTKTSTLIVFKTRRFPDIRFQKMSW